MNLAKLRQRMERMRERYQQLRPKEPPAPLVIRFSNEINRNAPIGTRADEDLDDDGSPDEFVMVPPGYRGPLPDNMLTFEEWLKCDRLVSKEKKNGG